MSQQPLAEAWGLPITYQPQWGNQVVRQVAHAMAKGTGPLHTAQHGGVHFKSDTCHPLAHPSDGSI